jgi:hypothetical protein
MESSAADLLGVGLCELFSQGAELHACDVIASVDTCLRQCNDNLCLVQHLADTGTRVQRWALFK